MRVPEEAKSGRRRGGRRQLRQSAKDESHGPNGKNHTTRTRDFAKVKVLLKRGYCKSTKACSNITPSHLSPLLDVLWLLPSSPATASQVGRGARWSADRAQAWELQDGELTRSISLQEAAQIAGSVGLPGAAARCERLAEEVDAGIVAHGTGEQAR